MTEKTTITLDTDTYSFQINEEFLISFKRLENKLHPMTPSLGLLPPVVRYVSPWLINNTSVVIIESRPETRSIYFAGRVYSIPLPWQHWFIHLHQPDEVNKPDNVVVANVGYAFSSTQFQTLDHIFYPPYLPSIDKLLIVDGLKLGWEINTLEVPLPIELDEDLDGFFKEFRFIFFHKQFDLSDIKYLQSYARRVNNKYRFPSKPKNIIKAIKILGELNIQGIIDLLNTMHRTDDVLTFKSIYDHFEKDVFKFDFGNFLALAVDVKQHSIAPSIISSQMSAAAVPIGYLGTRSSFEWFQEDCNPIFVNDEGEEETDSCDESHFDDYGIHYLTQEQWDIIQEGILPPTYAPEWWNEQHPIPSAPSTTPFIQQYQEQVQQEEGTSYAATDDA